MKRNLKHNTQSKQKPIEDRVLSGAETIEPEKNRGKFFAGESKEEPNS